MEEKTINKKAYEKHVDYVINSLCDMSEYTVMQMKIIKNTCMDAWEFE